MRWGALLAAVRATVAWALARPEEIPFERHLIDPGASETALFADSNGDGKLTLLSGENWYEAPGWRKHRFRELGFTDNYADDFSDLALEVDGDGRVNSHLVRTAPTFWAGAGRDA